MLRGILCLLLAGCVQSAAKDEPFSPEGDWSITWLDGYDYELLHVERSGDVFELRFDRFACLGPSTMTFTARLVGSVLQMERPYVPYLQLLLVRDGGEDLLTLCLNPHGNSDGESKVLGSFRRYKANEPPEPPEPPEPNGLPTFEVLRNDKGGWDVWEVDDYGNRRKIE